MSRKRNNPALGILTAPFPACDVIAFYFQEIAYILPPQNFPAFLGPDAVLLPENPMERYSSLACWIANQELTFQQITQEEKNIRNALEAQFSWLKTLQPDRRILRTLELYNNEQNLTQKETYRKLAFGMMQGWSKSQIRKYGSWLPIKPLAEANLYPIHRDYIDPRFKNFNPNRQPLDLDTPKLSPYL